MKKAVFICGLLFGLSVISFAQKNAAPSCPDISISDHGGINRLKVPVRFTATIDTKGRHFDLKYFWNVTSGRIVSGQGTTSIEVVQTEPVQTVALEIKGLPGRCPDTQTLSFSIEYLPEPIKLAQFDGSKFIGDKLELNQIVLAMNDNPNNQLYVYFAYKQEPLEKAAESREQHTVDYLATAIGDRSRITVVRLFRGADVVQFWRIPPGADNPKCEDCDTASCPEIILVGPAGITQPGDTMTYTVAPQVKNLNVLNFRWTTSSGTIIDGQGTAQIKVQTTREMNNSTTTVTVEVSGLRKGCPNSTSETAAVSSGFHPIVVDEFGKLPLNYVRGRLDAFLTEIGGTKGHVGSIILQYPKGLSQAKLKQRIRGITDHIFKFRRFPRERIVIFLEPSARENTKLYRTSAEDVEYLCHECKKY